MAKKWAFLIVVVVLILAIAALFVFNAKNLIPFSFVSGYAEYAADPHYDYSMSLAPITPGQPMRLTIKTQLNPSSGIATCNASNFNFGTCGNPSVYAAQPWCNSETQFNARSLRIFIDGNNVQDLYYYDKGFGYNLTSTLQSRGAVCCYAVSGGCNACQDLERNRAWVLTSGALPARQNISGKNITTVEFIQPSLAPGNHTLTAYWYSETLFTGMPYCSDRALHRGDSPLDKWDYGDKNIYYNNVKTIVFEVKNTTVVVNQTIQVNNTIYYENTTQINNLLAQKAQLEQQINQLSIILAQTQLNLTATRNSLTQAQAALVSANASLTQAQGVIVNLNQQISSLNGIIVSTQSELNLARNQLITVNSAYQNASAHLVTVQNAQTATQAQLASALSDLQGARNANVEYLASINQYRNQLEATQLLTVQQRAELTRLAAVASTKEQIANQSIALAAQKDAEAQAALSEVYRVMQAKSAADAIFQTQMQTTLAQLNSTSASLEQKIAALNMERNLLTVAYNDLQAAQTQLNSANAAISERQLALAQAQADIAALQKANADLKVQLQGQQSAPLFPALEEDSFILIGVVIGVLLILAGIYVWYQSER